MFFLRQKVFANEANSRMETQINSYFLAVKEFETYPIAPK
jgi:hypothetical protein